MRFCYCCWSEKSVFLVAHLSNQLIVFTLFCFFFVNFRYQVSCAFFRLSLALIFLAFENKKRILRLRGSLHLYSICQHWLQKASLRPWTADLFIHFIQGNSFQILIKFLICSPPFVLSKSPKTLFSYTRFDQSRSIIFQYTYTHPHCLKCLIGSLWTCFAERLRSDMFLFNVVFSWRKHRQQSNSAHPKMEKCSIFEIDYRFVHPVVLRAFDCKSNEKLMIFV